MVPGGGGKVEKSPMATPFLGAGDGAGPAHPAPPDDRRPRAMAWSPSSARGSRTPSAGSTGSTWTIRSSAPTSRSTRASRTFRRSTRRTITREFSEDSARWAVDFVEKLMLLRWQPAVKDLREARDPLENGFFADQAAVDAKAVEMLKKDGRRAERGGEIPDRPDRLADGEDRQALPRAPEEAPDEILAATSSERAKDTVAKTRPAFESLPGASGFRAS